MSQHATPADQPVATAAPSARGRRAIIAVGWWAWRIVRLPLIAYLVVLLMLMFLERTLVYPASQYPSGNWNPTTIPFEDADFFAPDGTKLHGWYVPHANPRAVVLFAHGNGGNLSDRALVLRLLNEKLRLSVMIFDYRGYGRSEGKPDEAGLLSDARAARAWLAERAGIGETDIVLLGRSLGGGVMVDLAAKDGARGLILESTFTSLPDAAAHHYPWIPVRLIMRNRFASIEKIDQYHGPLLQSHGTADEIIPFELGRRLHEAAASRNKKFIEIPGAGHNEMPSGAYYKALDEWIEGL
ncbi:MAG: alpha/beta hydrolase [Planctomycetes bacterium]|nr:alpha/beta hydrolase [Planctomycetota bacterium]